MVVLILKLFLRIIYISSLFSGDGGVRSCPSILLPHKLLWRGDKARVRGGRIVIIDVIAKIRDSLTFKVDLSGDKLVPSRFRDGAIGI